MRTARAWGVPLSVFRGQRPPGARWTFKDRLIAMAVADYEADLCGGCGEPRSESMDPANERAYVAPPPLRCHACTAIEARQEKYRDAQQPRALAFTVELARRVASGVRRAAP